MCRPPLFSLAIPPNLSRPLRTILLHLRLSSRCYAVTGLGYSLPWCVNSGFIVGEESTLVVDTGATPRPDHPRRRSSIGDGFRAERAAGFHRARLFTDGLRPGLIGGRLPSGIYLPFASSLVILHKVPTAAPCALMSRMEKNREAVLAEVRRRWRERDSAPFLPSFGRRESEPQPSGSDCR